VSLLGQRQMGQQALVKGLSKQLLAQAVELRPRVLYNPDLESRRFLVPGLIGIILMMMAALLTSGVVVRERERGTFELLAASPVSAAELLVGKLLPYLALGAFDVVLAVGVGWGVFGVVPQGNLLLLFALAMVFVLCSLSIGLFFSCVAPTQQLAMLLGFVTTVLPTMILSGFAFPVRNMPVFLQGVSQLLPATHFIAIARGIVLKGVGIGPVWDHVVALSVITAVLMRLALKRFRKTL
jgi:ABC-2 type transport system permease protein